MQIKFGSIVVDGAGKLGGHQIQGGRMAPSLVTKRSGNRKTQRQMTWQNKQVAKLSAVWRRMSPAEKALWDYHPAGKFKFLSRYEGKKELSGYSAFLRFNILTQTFNIPVFTDWRQGVINSSWGWMSTSNLIFPRNGAIGFNVSPVGQPAMPLTYIAGFNSGQKRPPPSQHHLVVDLISLTPNGHPFYRTDSNPFIKEIATKDYVSLWLRSWVEGFPTDYMAPAKRSVSSQSFFQ